MTKYVFDSVNAKRYKFPTHINDIVVDRADATTSEAFMVILEPGKATHVHKHDDVEQIFYILDGEGTLLIGADKQAFPLKPTQVARIPPGTLHTVTVKGDKSMRYFCIDCFCADNTSKSLEPTWEDHVKTICREQGYNFDLIAASGNN
jgi:mannose-6-phosphate isomerase-like protein (cupin superfamily)